MESYDVIIIGGGPAGVSASLYTVRSGLKTLIISKGLGALEKTHKIDNFYGFPDGVDGVKLVERGLEQAEKLNVDILKEEVVSIQYDAPYAVKTPSGKYSGSVIIIATGTSRNTPSIQGIGELEGKGVSYCAVCDGFFYKKKKTAVLGSGEQALNELLELKQFSEVALLTNGAELATAFPEDVKIYTQEIASIEGDPSLNCVRFKDGSSLQLSGLFVALGTAGSSEFAKKMGLELNGRDIVVNESMETNIPGIYAAGDCTGGLKQIFKAVYQGGIAGLSAIKYLRKS